MRRLIFVALIVAHLWWVIGSCQGQTRTRTGGRTGARGGQKVIQLTEPKLQGSMSLEEALAKRRSVRQFSGEVLKYSQIAQLAWAGQGITDPQRGLRTAPSAGALYPIDLYFATPDGLFVYRPQQHSLEQTINEDIRPRLAAVAGGHESIARAGCTIVIAGSSRKLAGQFRDQARTYTLLEAGHVAQNIVLQAVSLGLGSVTIGGFDSREVERLCRLPTGTNAIYLIPVGYAAAATPPTPTQSTDTTQPTASPALGKKVLLIVPSKDFHDEELFETQRAIGFAGAQITIASSRPGPIQGMLGNVAQAQLALNQVSVDDFDAIVFIGGPGAAEYFENPLALNIARDAAGKKKVLAAISTAPTILANAKVLTTFRVTAFVSEREKIQQAGAIYTGLPVERDRFIITGSGPMAAPQFGMAVAAALAGR
jgi:SagB-type dehydrogenase family enzyme